MSRSIFTKFFICLVAVCLVMGFYGMAARAAEPTRSAKAYEEQQTCIGGICYYTGRQYTSQYDLMRGQIFPNITVQYAMPDWMGAMTGSASSYSRGNAIGGLFSGPIAQLPVSGLSYMLGTMGAPHYESAESYSPWTGSMNYLSMYQGLGFGGAGFMMGPFSNMFGFGGGLGYGGFGGGYGYNPYGYYTGASSGAGGTIFPTRIY